MVGELSSECYAVVDGEGEEDGFYLEVIAIGQTEQQIEAADTSLVIEIAAIEEWRRGEARLLPEEVVTDAGQVPAYITSLAL